MNYNYTITNFPINYSSLPTYPHNNPNIPHTYNPPFSTSSLTLFTPLFQSILENPLLTYEILTHYYQYNYLTNIQTLYQLVGEEGDDDADKSLIHLLLYIQNNSNNLIFTSRETGEILAEIPLNSQTHNKKMEELLSSSSIENLEEVSIYA